MFQRLIHCKATTPDNFDFTNFGKAIKVGLETDNCVCTVKVLMFAYNNIPLFPKYVINRFIMLILRDRFVDLFCHWSKIVRNSFHHLLLYRIYHLYAAVDTDLSDVL